MKRSVMSRVVEGLLWCLVGTTVLALASLPWAIDWYLSLGLDSYEFALHYRPFLLAFLALAGLGGLWIIVELIMMLRTLGIDPFTARNVAAFRRMAVAALVLMALFAIKSIFFFTLLTATCALVLLVCSLLSWVMGEVFAQAVAYKQENDLTI